MILSSIDSYVSTNFLFNIHYQLRKYIIEDTCIHTIFQPGLNPYAPFSFPFWFSFVFIFFPMIVREGFLFTYFIWISWNQIKCNEIYIKPCFMKSSERNISQCILALWYFKVCCRVITYHNNINVLVKRRSSRPEVFCRKDVLRNFAKFTGKGLQLY